MSYGCQIVQIFTASTNNGFVFFGLKSGVWYRTPKIGARYGHSFIHS